MFRSCLGVALDGFVKELHKLTLRLGHILVTALHSLIYLTDGLRVCSARYLVDCGHEHSLIGFCIAVSLANVNSVEFYLPVDIVNLALRLALRCETARGDNLSIRCD